MHVAAVRPFTELTPEYQVLWRSDFLQNGRTVGSVACVARLSPIAERFDGFGRGEMHKIGTTLGEDEAE